MKKDEDKLAIDDIQGLAEVLEKSKSATIKFAEESKMPTDGLEPQFWNNCIRRSLSLPKFKEKSLEVMVTRIINSDKRFVDYIRKNDRSKTRILDIGSSMCQYAPLFHHLGFKTYVGIDLYHQRENPWGSPEETKEITDKIQGAAKAIMESAGMKEYWVLDGDANHAKSLIEERVDGWGEGQDQGIKFDVILAVDVCYNNEEREEVEDSSTPSFKDEGFTEEKLREIASELLEPRGFLLIVK